MQQSAFLRAFSLTSFLLLMRNLLSILLFGLLLFGIMLARTRVVAPAPGLASRIELNALETGTTSGARPNLPTLRVPESGARPNLPAPVR